MLYLLAQINSRQKSIDFIFWKFEHSDFATPLFMTMETADIAPLEFSWRSKAMKSAFVALPDRYSRQESEVKIRGEERSPARSRLQE
ncbi:hypothetical protein NPIL_150851 [Nephila pilipes]|uniref:Uncharacterized protein n=1 Tax=Nephila pilipes TaxID=299642 RepID=A0A8X6QL27_NEPPI|nr:hypothetical protein NPIL_150851 [Nephila pilipes]